MTGRITGDVTYHIDKMFAHYLHARVKHPYFCDWIGPDAAKESDRKRVSHHLGMSRQGIVEAMELHSLGWDDLLDCEVWEVFDAFIRGDKAHAVEELYDAIAVLLRTIDVLEGRQPLGRPEDAK